MLDDLAARWPADVLDRAQRSGLLVVGAVVALPGLVDSSGRLLTAPNLGWTGVPVAAELTARLGAPGVPRARGERGEPRRARRAVGGRRPAAARLHLHLGRARHRRRDHRRARALPRHARLRRRARSHDDRARRGGLRLRQPRLPGDAGRRSATCYTAAGLEADAAVEELGAARAGARPARARERWRRPGTGSASPSPPPRTCSTRTASSSAATWPGSASGSSRGWRPSSPRACSPRSGTSRASSPRRSAPRPRCAAPQPWRCGACSRIRPSSASWPARCAQRTPSRTSTRIWSSASFL